jgi:glutamate N-acetyltransferase/amino-acid N-acetyltransferase
VSVTAAAGFRASGVAAGLRSGSDAPDVALVVNDGPRFDAAGVFTTNRVKAAPVQWSQQVLRGGELRAVVLNAGGANACTGPPGFTDTHRSAEQVADRLGCGAGEVAVCSTGLIGERLPLDRLLAGIDEASAQLSAGGGSAAAEAIRTTDTHAKEAVTRSGDVTIGGMAKGAGMLAPSLATMLCVLTTDAVAPTRQLDAALRAATAVTFDRLDTDGCLSTNDTVLLLASGASETSIADAALTAALIDVCDRLAASLLHDAEGATKWVSIEVRAARTTQDAVAVGRAVARNNLLKCALAGSDPNWGRVLAAVGTTSAVFEPDRLSVAINDVWVCRDGAAASPRSDCDLSGPQVRITIDLAAGEADATIRTTDLTVGYVHENSAYST